MPGSQEPSTLKRCPAILSSFTRSPIVVNSMTKQPNWPTFAGILNTFVYFLLHHSLCHFHFFIIFSSIPPVFATNFSRVLIVQFCSLSFPIIKSNLSFVSCLSVSTFDSFCFSVFLYLPLNQMVFQTLRLRKTKWTIPSKNRTHRKKQRKTQGVPGARGLFNMVQYFA